MVYIIEDSRQKLGQHEQKHADFERMSIGLVRSKLHAGDYAYPPKCAVDTKQDIYELAMDIKNQHARFRAECVAAQEAGTQLIVLTENMDGIATINDLTRWVEPWAHYQMRQRKNRKSLRWSGKTLAKACITMSKKYGVAFRFCTPYEAASKIKEYLDWGESLGR